MDAVERLSYTDNKGEGGRCCGIGGKWQLIVCLAVFASKFAVAWHQLIIVILAPKQSFWCKDENIDKCSEECTEHVFNTSVFEKTITSEWDLVCDRAQLANVSQLTFMTGILLGNVVFGYLSDRFGRRWPLLLATIVQVISGVAVAFTPWLWLFMVLRFITALSTGGTMLTGFVLVTEVVPAKWRTAAGVLFQVPFQLGHASLGLIGYLLRDWHDMQLAISIPSVILPIAYYFLIPESPRWLLSVGRVDEALEVLHKAGKINNVPEDVRTQAEAEIRADCAIKDKNTNKAGNALELIKNGSTCIKTLCTCFNWVVIALCYFGVAQYMGQIGGDIFVNVAISGLIQTPANIGGIFIMDWKRVGRKGSMVLFFLICALSMLLIPAVPDSYQWILGCIGMMAISITFSVVYIWTGELFPTFVRNVAMGVASMFARFGSMTAPFVANLGEGVPVWVSPIVFGVTPLLAAGACWPLKETLGCKLQDIESDDVSQVSETKQEEKPSILESKSQSIS